MLDQINSPLQGVIKMCVITVVQTRRPSEDELTKMALTNGDGCGIAYRTKHGDIFTPSEDPLNVADEVMWEKGLSLEELIPLAARVPLPYVLHFRIASCGGKEKEMTHPFPLTRDVNLDLVGHTKGFVLFHNGHWGAWKDKGLDGAIHNKIRVPAGTWSDTRVMAWLAFLHGPKILEFIDEKVILFGPKTIEIFHPDGWFRVNDLLVSNRSWEYHALPRDDANDTDEFYFRHGGGGHQQVCRQGTCNKAVVGNSWYCTDHQFLCRWSNCSESRINNSEYCLNHQPLCSRIGCITPREPGESTCMKHKVFNGLTKQLVPGTSQLVPFRAGSLVVPAGPDQPQNTSGAQTELVRLDTGLPPVVDDPILQAQRRWACGINTKILTFPHIM